MRFYIVILTLFSFYPATTQAAINWKWLGSNTAVVTTPDNDFEQSSGKPLNVSNISARLDVNLLEDFYGMVPEYQQVNPALLESTFNNIDIRNNLDPGQKVTVKVAFLNEGAGYKNALGYFVYQTDTPPATTDDVEHILIFPNSSKTGSGGTLNEGDQVDLQIELGAGQSIGFFVNSNGWNGSYGYQNSTLKFGQPFYTLPSLNPNVGLGQRYHVVLNDTRSVTQGGSGFFAYGFEDIMTSYGDKDYNDLIFNVEVTPITAVEGYQEALVIQSVNDSVEHKIGTLAFEDNWPLIDDYDLNDAVVSYQITKTGDGENNNLTLKSLQLDYQIEAIGAAFHNGLAVSIPGLSESMIDSVTLTKNLNGQVTTITTSSLVHTKIASSNGSQPVSYPYPLIKDSELYNTDVSFTLSEDLFEELSTFDPSGLVFETHRCFYNTIENTEGTESCPAGTTAATLRLTVNLVAGAMPLNQLGAMPFDHYLFGTNKNDLFSYSRRNEGVDWFSSWKEHFGDRDAAKGNGPGKYLEIHLKQFNGTNVFESDFSRSDHPNAVTVDAQYIGDGGNHYISREAQRNGHLTGNLPWVLDLPANWEHPRERSDISEAYPDFYSWATDNNTNTDWYQTNINSNAIFNQ